MADVYVAYEEVKRGAGVIDFEDLLRAAVWAVEQHPDVADQVRGKYRHFVVDEYQDVNPAQERLLRAWLGERDDLTVVGDASQTIYSFTGASSGYLLSFARRCRGTEIGRRTVKETFVFPAMLVVIAILSCLPIDPAIGAVLERSIRSCRRKSARSSGRSSTASSPAPVGACSRSGSRAPSGAVHRR